MILWMHLANERRRYIVTSSHISWAHTQMIPEVINDNKRTTIMLLEQPSCCWLPESTIRLKGSLSGGGPPQIVQKIPTNLEVWIFVH